MNLPRYIELVRVSTAKQAERDTPEMQRRALDELRDRRPGKFVKRIEAPGVSGALPLAERKDLAEIKALSGKYDELRVYAVDRLTRAADPMERMAIFAWVKATGAMIVDVKGNTFDPATGDMAELSWVFETLRASGERARIMARTKDGQRRAAENGWLPAGAPPYARTWDKKSRTWGIDQERAKHYRAMFARVLKGDSIRKITDWLNESDVPSSRGAMWAWSTVGELLRTRAAIGEWKRGGHVIQVPPIIDEATFAAAGARLTANRWERGGRPSTADDALLHKLLACGRCGSTLYVRRAGKGGRDRFYVCGASVYRRGFKDCSRWWPVAKIDAIVRGKLEAFLRDPKPLGSVARIDKEDDLAATAAAERRALEKLEKEEDRLLRLARRRLIPDAAFERQARELAALREASSGRLRRAEASLAARAGRGDLEKRIDARLDVLRRRIDRATAAEWHEVIRMLFPRTPGFGLRLHPNGRLDGHGMLTLDHLGAGEVGKAASKLSAAAWSTGQFEAVPLRLSPARLGATGRRANPSPT